MLLTDRTTIETDWTCGMKRWWYKEHGGTGIVPAVEPDYFTDGGELHELLAFVASAADPREVFDRLPPAPADQIALEKWSRLVGWVTAFVQWVEPRWREVGDTIQVERELVLERDPLWITCTPDRVIRRRGPQAAGQLMYVEYKTTGAFDLKAWADYWPHAVQVHIGLQALEEDTNEKVAWGQVQGFVKGRNKDGKLRHPYVWAYSNGSEWSAEWTRGWDLVPVWEFPGGPRAWADHLGPDVAREVTPLSNSIFLDRRLVARVVAERTERERLVASVRSVCQLDVDLRHRVFASNFTQCKPQFGSPCTYRSACWNASVEADPIASGEFVPRTPHHEIERVMTADQSGDN